MRVVVRRQEGIRLRYPAPKVDPVYGDVTPDWRIPTCSVPLEKMANRIGADVIDTVHDTSFCAGVDDPDCWCILSFRVKQIRDEWVKRAAELHSDQYERRKDWDSLGNIGWLATRADVDPGRPWLSTDIPTLDRSKAIDAVNALKLATNGNCYIQDIHDEGHLGANHIHLICERSTVSTPDRTLSAQAQLDMVSDVASRIVEP